jgi:hypothetical protein
VEKLAGLEHDPETEPRKSPEHPPGEFVSDELETDTARFLRELREVIARRSEPFLEDEGD